MNRGRRCETCRRVIPLREDGTLSLHTPSGGGYCTGSETTPTTLKGRTMTTAIVRKVKNLVNPEQSWCVQWRSAIMPAPAFWYYPTEAEARDAVYVLTGSSA